MQPNLKSNNVTNLELQIKVPFSSDLVAKILEASKPDKDGDSVFFDSYNGHRCLAWVDGIKRKLKKHEVTFLYEAKSGGILSEKHPRIQKLGEFLSLVSEKLIFECIVSFTFSRKFHAKSIIPIPMKYIELPNKPFDRIQGLHLVKKDGTQKKYDIYIEAPNIGVLHETILFDYVTSFNKDIANKILSEAVKISNEVVFRKNKDI